MQKNLNYFCAIFLLLFITAAPSFAQPATDTDGDGITDIKDLDDDNDGILDTNEGCANPPSFESGGTYGTTTVFHDLSTAPGGGYTYATLSALATYAVISDAAPNWHLNPGLWNYPGHTTGAPDDAYLAVNGSSGVGTFYNQVLPFISGIYYNFNMWHASAYNCPPSQGYNLKISVTRVSDSFEVASAISGVQTTATWQPLAMSFTVPVSGDYRISLVNVSTQFGGNDFSIDDLSLSTQCDQDTDGDGIPDALDNDSDNDGCADALEGGEPFQAVSINANGSLVGSVTSYGIPLIAGGGQTIGASIDSTIKNACLLPIAIDDTRPYPPGSTIDIAILGNDTLGDLGLPSSVILVNADPGSNGKTKTVPGEGTWSVHPTTGVLTFTPQSGLASLPTFVQYTITDSDSSVSNIANVTFSAPLPVGLLEFSAVKNGTVAKLDWEIGTRSDGGYFEIECSNGNDKWMKKGNLKMSLAQMMYTFNDIDPAYGVNPYRLRIINKDSSQYYSKINSVIFDKKGNINIYPNPAKDYLMIEGLDKPAVLKLMTISGREIMQMDNFEGPKLDLRYLQSGIYILKLLPASGEPITFKLVKK